MNTKERQINARIMHLNALDEIMYKYEDTNDNFSYLRKSNFEKINDEEYETVRTSLALLLAQFTR